MTLEEFGVPGQPPRKRGCCKLNFIVKCQGVILSVKYFHVEMIVAPVTLAEYQNVCPTVYVNEVI